MDLSDPTLQLELTERDGATSLPVHVTPRASRQALTGVHGGALKVSLTAPPVEGAANAALVELLASALGVPRRAVSVVQGDRGRRKLVRVHGLTAAQVRAAITDAIVSA